MSQNRPTRHREPPPVSLREFTACALFAAVLIAVAMLYSCLPAAVSVLAQGASGEVSGRDMTVFFVTYAILVIGPLAGWSLWWIGRTAMALAALAPFGLAVAAMAPMAAF
ncbi:MAG: hypothetical protein Q7J28_10210 [Caulobacter sp.]|nr:hypothetical protein [Caulobacter sp.]